MVSVGPASGVSLFGEVRGGTGVGPAVGSPRRDVVVSEGVPARGWGGPPSDGSRAGSRLAGIPRLRSPGRRMPAVVFAWYTSGMGRWRL